MQRSLPSKNTQFFLEILADQVPLDSKIKSQSNYLQSYPVDFLIVFLLVGTGHSSLALHEHPDDDTEIDSRSELKRTVFFHM